MDESNSSTSEKPKKKRQAHGNAHIKAKRSSASLPSKSIVFYDHNRHPAAVLHQLRPEITPNQYQFTEESVSSSPIRFHCSIGISEGLTEPITVDGFGRSKQLAKNMAAQVKSQLKPLTLDYHVLC